MFYSINGIKLPKNKISSYEKIADVGLPDIVYIELKQNTGIAPVPVVKKGGSVKIGTLIAKAAEGISANMHSSVAGKVLDVTDRYISIKVSADEYDKSINTTDEILTTIPDDKEFILNKIKEMGIVGMGGAGFPTDVKLTIPEDKKIECLVLNGMECEPYFTADNRLMVEKAEEIVIGARIINKALGIQNAIIAIDENDVEAIEVMDNVTKRYVGVNVEVLSSKYPQGAERQLIKAISDDEISRTAFPSDAGFVVQNVATVYAVYEAVMKNKPLYQRVITVSGDIVLKPQNFLVRVGTPASYLIKKAGVNPKKLKTAILGGQMMGQTIQDLDTPVTKLNGGLLLFETAKPNEEESVCIRCNSCAQNCPVNLQPFAIADMYKVGDTPKIYKLRPEDCIKCGICSYVCPAKIPLLDYIKKAREEM